MSRPTITDLAEAAGVSVSTVNRILHGKGPARAATKETVLQAAEAIGFYGANAIRERNRRARPTRRIGVLLQQSHRPIYREMAAALAEACRRRDDVSAVPLVRFADDLRPEAIAAALRDLGREVDAAAIVAPDHPLIAQAVGGLADEGKPVFAFITDLSTPRRAGYVGTDNWKLGRTAAWFIAQTTCRPGRVQVFIGNHRYQCQDISDASFRSYMRENAAHLTIDDSLPTHEEPREAHRLVSKLLAERDDLVGVYVAGGGISGVLQALREAPEDRRRSFRVVCRDIGPETRRGLAEGLITAALCHPLEQTSDQLIQAMIDAATQTNSGVILQRTLPFEIITPESL
jgi:LacI family transcriptional regulator